MIFRCAAAIRCQRYRDYGADLPLSTTKITCRVIYEIPIGLSIDIESGEVEDLHTNNFALSPGVLVSDYVEATFASNAPQHFAFASLYPINDFDGQYASYPSANVWIACSGRAANGNCCFVDIGLPGHSLLICMVRCSCNYFQSRVCQFRETPIRVPCSLVEKWMNKKSASTEMYIPNQSSPTQSPDLRKVAHHLPSDLNIALRFRLAPLNPSIALMFFWGLAVIFELSYPAATLSAEEPMTSLDERLRQDVAEYQKYFTHGKDGLEFIKLTGPNHIKEWQIGAEMGIAAGQFLLGHAFFAGSGVTKNDALAFEWFRKSANQGYGPAAQLPWEVLCVRYWNPDKSLDSNGMVHPGIKSRKCPGEILRSPVLQRRSRGRKEPQACGRMVSKSSGKRRFRC